MEVLRVQDVGLLGASDVEIFEWALVHECVLVTRDARTMVPLAKETLSKGAPVPALIVVPRSVGIGPAIAEICELLSRSTLDQLMLHIHFLPISRYL